MEDSGIINLFFSRSESAIQEVHEKYGHFCYKIAWNILENREDSEESVNDTYLSAWWSIPPTRPKRLAAYLAKLTRHHALDCWRKRNTEKRGSGETALALEELEDCLSGGDTTQAALMGKQLQEALDRFLENLPKNERMIFVARYWYLYSVKEIARRTGASESRIKTQLFRTRNRLRFFLQKEELL